MAEAAATAHLYVSEETKVTAIRSGFLKKQGIKWKTWKNRYFILHDDALYYLVGPKDNEAIGTIKLKGAVVQLEPNQKKKFTFSIQSKESYTKKEKHVDRKYFIVASNEEDLKGWMDALQRVTNSALTTFSPANGAPPPSPSTIKRTPTKQTTSGSTDKPSAATTTAASDTTSPITATGPVVATAASASAGSSAPSSPQIARASERSLPHVILFGATSLVGSALVRELASLGFVVRCPVRAADISALADPRVVTDRAYAQYGNTAIGVGTAGGADRGRGWWWKDALTRPPLSHFTEFVFGVDLAVPETLTKAFAGCQGSAPSNQPLLIVIPPQGPQLTSAKAAVEAAKAAGIRSVMTLSTLHADKPSATTLGRWHREVERCVSELFANEQLDQVVFVRTNWLFQLLLVLFPNLRKSRELALPIGDGRVSWVDARDVAIAMATAAAQLLRNPELRSKRTLRELNITGPESLTAAAMVTTVREVARSKAFRHVDDMPADRSPWETYFDRTSKHLLPFLEWVEAARRGDVAEVLPPPELPPGKKLRTFREFADEFAEWLAEPDPFKLVSSGGYADVSTRIVRLFLAENHVPFEYVSTADELPASELAVALATRFARGGGIGLTSGTATLVDTNGFSLNEVSAILPFVVRRCRLAAVWYPALPSNDSELRLRARIDQYLDWHHDNLARATAAYVAARSANIVARDYNTAASVSPLPTVPDAERALQNSLKILDIWLAGGRLLAGGTDVSMADVVAVVTLTALDLVDFPNWANFTAVSKWREQVKTRLVRWDDVNGRFYREFLPAFKGALASPPAVLAATAPMPPLVEADARSERAPEPIPPPVVMTPPPRESAVVDITKIANEDALPPVRLFHSPASPQSRAVYVLCLTFRIPLDVVIVDRTSPATCPPGRTAAPTIVHGNVVIDEAAAALVYLAQRYPRRVPPSVYPMGNAPGDIQSRCAIEQLLEWSHNHLRRAGMALLWQHGAHPEDVAGLMGSAQASMPPATIAEVDELTAKTFRVLEYHIRKTGERFLVGVDVSLADISLAADFTLFEMLFTPVELEARAGTVVVGWRRRVAARLDGWNDANAHYVEHVVPHMQATLRPDRRETR